MCFRIFCFDRFGLRGENHHISKFGSPSTGHRWEQKSLRSHSVEDRKSVEAIWVQKIAKEFRKRYLRNLHESGGSTAR